MTILKVRDFHNQILGFAELLIAPAFLFTRIYIANIFFKSGLTKLRDWESTLMLFEYEYEVPMLSYEVAAWLATAGELILPVLLFLGLFTRLSAIGLFIVNAVAVISLVDIPPAAFNEHVLWGSLIVMLIILGGQRFSLDRMLKEYVKNATKPGFSESLTRAYQSVGAMTGGGGDEHAEGSGAGAGPGKETTTANKIDPMSLVTARVEEELKAPLQNMLGGDLMQLLLIQTQVMKVEMEDALLQMDAVMRANRLNFALMACFPATLFVYGSVSFSKTVGAARAFQKRRKAREEMRLLVADAERSLMRLKMTRDEFTKRRRALEDNNEDNSDSDDASDSNLIHRLEIAEEHRRRRLELDPSFDATAAPSSPAARLHATKNKFDDENLENETFHQGMLLYAVNALYASVQKHKRMFTPKEFRGVKLDAMALADVGVSIEGKLLTTQRLARIYKGFQSEPHRVPSIVTGRYPI